MAEETTMLQRIKEQKRKEEKNNWYGIKDLPASQKRSIALAVVGYIVVFAFVGILYGGAYVIAGIAILVGLIMGGFLWLIALPATVNWVKSRLQKNQQ